MICVLGDIHFRDDKDYFRSTCESFLDWFKNWSYNSLENTLILAGDLVEKNLLTGVVTDYLERFSNYSRFKEIHIVVGNHDLKKVNDIPQLSYEFYSQKKNIRFYKEISEIEIEDKRILLLPYYKGLNDKGLSMRDFYSNLYQDSEYQKHYDLVVGHVLEPSVSPDTAVDCISNLEKLDCTRVCLGHVHTKDSNPSLYLGSVFAGKKNENGSRTYLIIDKDVYREEKLPLFNEFLTVVYPQSLPRSKALNPIYTILNCNNETTAKELYKNVYIRNVVSSLEDEDSSSSEFDRDFNSVKNLDISALFTTFLQDPKRSIPLEVQKMCKPLLTI